MAGIAEYMSPQDQLAALKSFTNWAISEIRRRESERRVRMGWPSDAAEAYARAVAIYLALAVTKLTDRCTTLTTWNQTNEGVTHTFVRQATPMVWDYAEVNPFGPQGFDAVLETLCRALEVLPAGGSSGDLEVDRAAAIALRDTGAITARMQQMGLPI